MCVIFPGETVDELAGGLKIIQKRDGFRFGTDAVLLAWFATVKKGGRVADLCTGSGIVPLLLASLPEAGFVSGLEIQDEYADMARRSVKMSGLLGRIEIRAGDVRAWREHYAPESFDVVTANPPYRTAGSGRESVREDLLIARHEVKLTLSELCNAAGGLLRPGGRFAVVHRADRMGDVAVAMREYKVELKRFVPVYGKPGSPAVLILAEGIKGASPGVVCEPPVVMYESDGRWSERMAEIYGRWGYVR